MVDWLRGHPGHQLCAGPLLSSGPASASVRVEAIQRSCTEIQKRMYGSGFRVWGKSKRQRRKMKHTLP